MAVIMDALGFAEYPYSGPRGSYFIWKGKAREDLIPKAKKVFNSPENKDGKLLKIMFGTQAVMEGVDFKNVRQVHILDPWWNDSRVQQIIARSIRLCSHSSLPKSQRIVDVFIHLSTLGSAESLSEVTINKKLPGGLKEAPFKVKAYLQHRENPDEPDPSKWVYREVYIRLNKDSEATISTSAETFLATKIVKGSIRRLPDPSLTRAFGHHKNLDSISVQQYMYNISLKKLKLNRQFESAIKEVAIDCTINKYGNIIRLDEFYTPMDTDGLWSLEYENYSSGARYTREGVPSSFTMNQILENVALNSGKFKFKNVTTQEDLTTNRSLVMYENIDCDPGSYTFDSNIPRQLINSTINKELIPFIMKLSVRQIKQYFYDIQMGSIKPVDPTLRKKLNSFLSKDSQVQKEEIIKKLVDVLGVGDESVWELYPLDQLKKEYMRLKKIKK
jgi:hypothetical protein